MIREAALECVSQHGAPKLRGRAVTRPSTTNMKWSP